MFKRLALLWKTHRSAAGSRLKRILFGLIIWGLITGVLFADLDSSKVFLQNGDVAKRDILAPKTISYTTFGIRSRAEILNDIETLFVYLANDSKADLDSTMKGRQLWDELEERPALLEYLTSLEPEQLHLLRDQVQALIIPYMNRGIPEDEFDTYREQIAKEIGSLELETNSQELLLTLTAKLLKDLPKKKTIKKGEIIIRHGDRATPEDIYVLKELGLYGIEARRRLNILGGGLVSLLLFASVFLFMYRFRPKVLESDSLLAMVGIVAVVSLALSKMVLILSHSGVYFRGMNIFSPYLCPLSTASMLITILIGADMGILLTVVLSVLIGLMEIEGIKLTITLFFGGLAGIMAVSRVSQRADIIRAGFYVSLAHVFFLLGLYLFKAEAAFSTFSQPLFRDIITGFVGGFTATILTIGGLPYLENFFKITTSIKLLEFSDLNQPLMQELLVKAPGTYHHSIVVANMAEASAEMIGADPLLCKIGGYYHDIGKLKRPYFFVENQIGIENQHESLSPYLSTLIISSHVKDGIELAKKYNLASPIIDIVAQHQGTGLITYFYHRAREQAADPDEVREEEFRYPGPKPHSKEAALVMLADAIESAARTLNNPTPNNIQNLVTKITRAKFEGEQFNDCDVTLKDLERINRTFATILTGMYHSRIEYPEEALTGFKKPEQKKQGKPKKVKPKVSGNGKINGNKTDKKAADGPTDTGIQQPESSKDMVQANSPKGKARKKTANNKKKRKDTATASGDNNTEQVQQENDPGQHD